MVVLLAVMSSLTSADALRERRHVAVLIAMARAHLQARLGVDSEIIQPESVGPLLFPGIEADTCQAHGQGYRIELTAGADTYTYNAKMVNDRCMLWYERNLEKGGSAPGTVQGQRTARYPRT
jgi:hypothetical protein